jgi:1,2-diacylglycerol 3-alpha-glucosyltransferase
MKIVHLCLACFYIEGMEYQENVLPRKHRQLGHEVEVITSQYCFDTKGNVFDRELGEYVNKDDVKVRVIPYNTKLFGRFARHCRIFLGLYRTLCDIKPDVIFCHGGQFCSVGQVTRYVKNNPDVRLYMDSHADYGNSRVDTWTQRISKKLLWGSQYKKLERYCRKMWATLPVRMEYMRDLYSIKSDKVQLLVMGGDVENIDEQERNRIRARVREKYGIDESTFLMVTGGKIDKKKNIHLLMEAVLGMEDKDVSLLVFGEPSSKFKVYIDSLPHSDKIKMAGWLSPVECYDLFYAADLGVFPGTHSVLWEQVCACGLPAIFRGTEGQNHVDMGGNCQFVFSDDAGEIKAKILEIIETPGLYAGMKKVAREKGYSTFSYMEIAKRAIEI